eukprot:6391076-Amphidinium_carterae.2
MEESHDPRVLAISANKEGGTEVGKHEDCARPKTVGAKTHPLRESRGGFPFPYQPGKRSRTSMDTTQS